jgi:hypothetical protein
MRWGGPPRKINQVKACDMMKNEYFLFHGKFWHRRNYMLNPFFWQYNLASHDGGENVKVQIYNLAPQFGIHCGCCKNQFWITRFILRTQTTQKFVPEKFTCKHHIFYINNFIWFTFEQTLSSCPFELTLWPSCMYIGFFGKLIMHVYTYMQCQRYPH